jgi:hypothetical protein
MKVMDFSLRQTFNAVVAVACAAAAIYALNTHQPEMVAGDALLAGVNLVAAFMKPS